MSEYSTDDLVKWVEGIAPGFHECCPPLAIIARLRAADALMVACVGAGWFIENFGGHRHMSEHPEECAHCHLLTKLRKAIAGYEGKE